MLFYSYFKTLVGKEVRISRARYVHAALPPRAWTRLRPGFLWAPHHGVPPGLARRRRSQWS